MTAIWASYHQTYWIKGNLITLGLKYNSLSLRHTIKIDSYLSPFF